MDLVDPFVRSWLSVPGFVPLLTLVPLLYPHGRPGRRWRPAAAAGLVGIGRSLPGPPLPETCGGRVAVAGPSRQGAGPVADRGRGGRPGPRSSPPSPRWWSVPGSSEGLVRRQVVMLLVAAAVLIMDTIAQAALPWPAGALSQAAAVALVPAASRSRHPAPALRPRCRAAGTMTSSALPSAWRGLPDGLRAHRRAAAFRPRWVRPLSPAAAGVLVVPLGVHLHRGIEHLYYGDRADPAKVLARFSSGPRERLELAEVPGFICRRHGLVARIVGGPGAGLRRGSAARPRRPSRRRVTQTVPLRGSSSATAARWSPSSRSAPVPATRWTSATARSWRSSATRWRRRSPPSGSPTACGGPGGHGVSPGGGTSPAAARPPRRGQCRPGRARLQVESAREPVAVHPARRLLDGATFAVAPHRRSRGSPRTSGTLSTTSGSRPVFASSPSASTHRAWPSHGPPTAREPTGRRGHHVLPDRVQGARERARRSGAPPYAFGRSSAPASRTGRDGRLGHRRARPQSAGLGPCGRAEEIGGRLDIVDTPAGRAWPRDSPWRTPVRLDSCWSTNSPCSSTGSSNPGRTDDLEIVGEATDGSAAVAVVAELAPDIMLIDLDLPNLSGVEATHASCARPRRRGC